MSVAARVSQEMGVKLGNEVYLHVLKYACVCTCMYLLHCVHIPYMLNQKPRLLFL